VEERKQPTPSVDAIRRAEHAVLLRSLTELALCRKVLPLVLARLEFFVGLDLSRNLGWSRWAIADLTRLLLSLNGFAGVDVGSCGDDTRKCRGCRCGSCAWSPISLAFLRLASYRLNLVGVKCLCGRVALERDNVDRLARGARDRRDLGWIKGFVP
jgi:hypothetical protein